MRKQGEILRETVAFTKSNLLWEVSWRYCTDANFMNYFSDTETALFN